MNEFKKLKAMKTTENGDTSYNTTGKELVDIMFMADYFEKHLDEVKIGKSEYEKLFSMYMRDPRHGQGRRDLGRVLLEMSDTKSEDVILSGRYDDLWNIARDNDLKYLKEELEKGNELAKKWMPRLGSKNNKEALIFCKMWELDKKQYRELIKCESTVEYKLSYAEEDKDNGTPLNKLFKSNNCKHPLVNEIVFSQVPSLAMTKYLRTFSTREDLKDRFNEYMSLVKEDKVKINTSTANVHNAMKVVTRSLSNVSENSEILGKKIVEQETANLELDCLCILDTSGSMGSLSISNSLVSKATSVAHALTMQSTYCKGQLIGFSRNPKLITIKGETLKDQYHSMYTGEIADTDFGKVMKLLQNLDRFPEYFVVLSDMEFNQGSTKSKEETMKMLRENGIKTKIIWWNFNNRHRTSPELDEYGNVFMSGFDLQALLQVPGIMDSDEYLNKILKAYAEKINLTFDF